MITVIIRQVCVVVIVLWNIAIVYVVIGLIQDWSSFLIRVAFATRSNTRRCSGVPVIIVVIILVKIWPFGGGIYRLCAVMYKFWVV